MIKLGRLRLLIFGTRVDGETLDTVYKTGLAARSEFKYTSAENHNLLYFASRIFLLSKNKIECLDG